MDLTIHFKGENGKITPSEAYAFEDEEAKRMIKDFLSTASSARGVYKYNKRSDGINYPVYL